MTVWYAQSSNGNISDANKWGNAPTSPSSYLTFSNLAAEDILQLNGKTLINVDVSFACTRISTVQEGGQGTTSGSLLISSGSITIGTSETKVTIKNGTSSATPLTVSGGTVVINGDVDATGNFVCPVLSMAGDSTSLTINGKVTGGQSTASHGISKTGNGTLVINNLGAEAIYVAGSGKGVNVLGGGGTITVNGNINAYGSGGYGIYTTSSSTVSMVVNGNVYGTGGGGISMTASSGAGQTCTVNGNVTGGSSLSCTYPAVGVGAYCTATIHGNVTGGNCSAAYGLSTQFNSRPSYVYGTVAASAYTSGVNAYLSAIVYIQGSLYDSTTASAYSGGVRINMPNTASIHRVYDWDGNAVNLPLQLPNFDVKKGLVHGEVVGTLPPASAFRRTDRFV